MNPTKPNDFASLDLKGLTEVPVSKRDEAWEEIFLKALPQAQLRIVNDSPVAGPDGWPYLLVATDGDEPFLKVAQWLVTQGVGVVINPEKPIPDYVITYGMIWNLRERGEFFTRTEKPSTGPVDLKNGQQVYAGPPSEAYLPKDVRVIMREFLRQQKVETPKVLMVSEDQKRWDLALSLESLGSPPETEHAGIAEAISWFLPGHYSIVLMRESTLPGFVEL
jgi:hypothetical protein